jgi:hypothetical protein
MSLSPKQFDYATTYSSMGEYLKSHKLYNTLRPSDMSVEQWRGPAGNTWRQQALTLYKRARGGRKHRRGTKRRRVTKRSTRRR